MNMDKTLLDKYNVPVPRYTSYPPANFFTEDFGEGELKEAIAASNKQTPNSISFYFHMPFCHHLCHYCGCNSYPAPPALKVSAYVDALHKEIDIVTALIDPSRKISQIHFGGGTPTFFPIEVLKELNQHVMGKFGVIEHPEIAAECHPGWLAEKDWLKLSEAGFTRLSIGLQDFNLKVLEAVRRQPPLIPVEKTMQLLREKGIKVNFDFLYGLPYQTADSFASTIRHAIALNPDRLVTFSYAHVPAMFPRQRVLEKIGLPAEEEKKRMFEAASALLSQAGYRSIGLDHFVKAEDELALALDNGQLHRNFQGYCTRRTTGQVYAFGASAITQLNNAYAQNTKDINKYIGAIQGGEIPVAKGYALSEQQQVARVVIETLMCNYTINWQELTYLTGLSVGKIKESINFNQNKLQEFADDGIVNLSDEGLSITPEGRLFVRNVAASMDPLMINTTKSFSKPV